MSGEVFHHDEPVMGTVVAFDLYRSSLTHEQAVIALSRARAGLHRVDAVFSTYREHSPMNQVRQGEMSVAEAPPQIAEVLSLCAQVREISDGWFDPWAMPGGVDPTGLVKGWSVERAIESLVFDGIDVASVNAGGDISTAGSLAPDTPWRFGIQDPFQKGRLVAVVEVAHAIATSGDYERSQHLYDPSRKRFFSAVASATVVGDDLALADGLATALAVAGESLLPSIERAGYQGFVVLFNAEVRSTADFPFA